MVRGSANGRMGWVTLAAELVRGRLALARAQRSREGGKA